MEPRGATLRYAPILIGPNPIEMPFSKLTACLPRVVEPAVPHLYRRTGPFARSLAPRGPATISGTQAVRKSVGICF
jgi:hypothetical protein